MLKGRIKYIVIILGIYLLVTALAPIIATDLPWYAKYNGEQLFPAFSREGKLSDGITGKITPYSLINWKELKLESVIWAPVPYNPKKSDNQNYHYVSPSAYQTTLNNEGKVIEMPLRSRHWLGTGKRGEDILSMMIHGGRISLFIGLLAALVSGIIGITLGIMSGYFRNDKIRIRWPILISIGLGIYLALFYGFYVRRFALSSIIEKSTPEIAGEWLISFLIAITIMIILIKLGKLLSKKLSGQILIPLDNWISSIIELFILMPRLLVVLVIICLTGPSVGMLILVIGLSSWMNIARITRAGFMRVKQESYIEWANSAGYKDIRIILKHILPNVFAPLIVSLIFNITSSIFVESSLSFIGLGLPPDTVSIGSIISSSRENMNAYWMIIPPSLFIMGLILSLNSLAEHLAIQYKTKDWI